MRLAGNGDLEFEQRCYLYQRRMPGDAFFSHATAARLMHIPVSWRAWSDPRVHIALPAPSRAPHAAGIAGHKLVIEDDELIVLPGGLRVTSPVRTWLDLAAVLPLLDLIAAGDHLIHWRRPMAHPHDLTAAVEERKNRRGRRLLLRALGLLHDRAESPQESKLRTLIVLAGLPQPRINHSVTDRFGEFVGRTDLIIDEFRLVIEYMGDYHRTTPGQWRADMSRRSKIEAEGWRVMEVNADDLKDPAELIQRIRDFARLPRLARIPFQAH